MSNIESQPADPVQDIIKSTSDLLAARKQQLDHWLTETLDPEWPNYPEVSSNPELAAVLAGVSELLNGTIHESDDTKDAFLDGFATAAIIFIGRVKLRADVSDQEQLFT